ncbi:MAG: hypothetical protein II983_07115 [Firmicutes bacterium]|nr:hypothetical protein [Bacillota bacterium]MBQ4505430.1 hypothetical protein [Bacillota bacterium]MBQ6686536.1 hypothetical protein [Bacillota bacterium]
MKNTGKKQGKNVIRFIGMILVIIIGLFMLFADVLAAEGYFGDPEEWSHWDTRNLQRVCGVIAIAVWLLTGNELPRKRKWGEIESEESEECEEHEEHKTAG